MSIIPAGASALVALFYWPRWVYAALGGFALFKAGSTLMAGAFSWLLHRDPSFLDRMPEPGWPWSVNLALYSIGGVWLMVYAYRKAPIERKAEPSTKPKGGA